MKLDEIKKLPIEQQRLLANKLEGEIYKNSLYLTAKYLLGYKDVTMRTHGGMIASLEADTKRKLIVMPRGTFKSSIGSVAYPIWCLLREPNERILLDGELYTNSKNFLREIKLHLVSEKLTRLYGEFRTDSVWNEGEIIINQRTKIHKEASITASGIGSERTGQHYDRIICDDLNSPSNSGTQEGLDRVLSHHRYNQAILEPEGTIAIIGTRYSERDLISSVLKNEIMIDEDEVRT